VKTNPLDESPLDEGPLEEGMALPEGENFPNIIILMVLTISLSPILMNLFGFDFGSSTPGFNVTEVASWNLKNTDLADEMFYTLKGGLQHALLEWSAVIVALMTVMLSFIHYRINRDFTVPIIGIALVSSGFTDAFHTLAAMRLIDAVADNTDLIPFTWALSRGFHSTILVVGVLIALLFLKHKTIIRGPQFIGIICVLFIGVAYILVHMAATSDVLPQTQFPDNFITRPYDAVPLVLLIFSIPLFLWLHKKNASPFTAALVLALVPDIILATHMAFGSSSLFDNHFNIAHFLKIIAYLVPFIGLMLDYIYTHTRLALEVAEKQQAQGALVRTTKIAESTLARMETILSLAPNAIISIDKKGKILSFNKAACKIFEYSLKEVVGQNVKMLMDSQDQKNHDDYLERYYKTDKKRMIDMRRVEMAVRRNGKVFPIDISVSEHPRLLHRKSRRWRYHRIPLTDQPMFHWQSGYHQQKGFYNSQ